MIAETARPTVDPHRVGEYEAAIGRALPIILSQEGCLGATFRRSEAEPGVYLLVVEWRSKADHVEGFRRSSAYEEWRRLLHPFYDSVPDVECWEPVGSTLDR